jgi:hypothetical protein
MQSTQSSSKVIRDKLYVHCVSKRLWVAAQRLRSLHVLEQEVRYCLEWSYHYVCVLSEPPFQQERDLALNDGKLHLGL